NGARECLGRNVRGEPLPGRDIVRYLWTAQPRRNIAVPDRVVLPSRRFDRADPVTGTSSADQERHGWVAARLDASMDRSLKNYRSSCQEAVCWSVVRRAAHRASRHRLRLWLLAPRAVRALRTWA